MIILVLNFHHKQYCEYMYVFIYNVMDFRYFLCGKLNTYEDLFITF